MPRSAASRSRSPLTSLRTAAGEVFGSVFLQDAELALFLAVDACTILEVAAHLPRHVNVAYMRQRDILMLDHINKLPTLVRRRWNDQWWWCNCSSTTVALEWAHIEFDWDGTCWICRFEVWSGQMLDETLKIISFNLISKYQQADNVIRYYVAFYHASKTHHQVVLSHPTYSRGMHAQWCCARIACFHDIARDDL